MANLPTVGGDNGNWGTILNEFLRVEHNEDGTHTIPGADTTAIHDNQSNEIGGLAEKSTPVSADILMIEDSADNNAKKKVQVGNLPTSSSLNTTSISPTNANITASVNTRYFANVSGLTADRNFVIPGGAVGNEIEISLTSGDDAYELIVVGDSGITINGGSAATEWSRLFITGESVRFVATSTTNWQVVYDGRIPCLGLMTMATNDTTNTAATNTLLTWDNSVINTGNICDLTNNRFNIRRAGYYSVTGLYQPAGTPSSGSYLIATVYMNGTSGTTVSRAHTMVAAANNLASVALPSRSQLCIAGDFLGMYYRTQTANVGGLATECWFQIKEG